MGLLRPWVLDETAAGLGGTADIERYEAVVWFPGASPDFVVGVIIVFAVLIAVYYLNGGDE